MFEYKMHHCNTSDEINEIAMNGWRVIKADLYHREFLFEREYAGNLREKS